MGGKIDKMLSVLDADKDGAISPLEIKEWMLDEEWKANPVFENPAVRAQWQDVVTKLERALPEKENTDAKKQKEYKQFSRHEVTELFKHMTPEDQKLLADSLLESDSRRRPKLIADVFKQMDTSGDGKVSREELINWIKHETAFRLRHGDDAVKISEAANNIVSALHKKDGDSLVLADFEAYFANMTLRQIRVLTSDLMQASHRRQREHNRILAKLDPRNTGVIDAVELDEWIKDETFADNVRLLELLKPLEEKMKAKSADDERKGTHSISRAELNWFLNTLHPMDFFYLAKQVLTEDAELLNEVIEQVFETMDLNGDGTVDRAEVVKWVQSESFFKAHADGKVGPQLTPDNVLKRLAGEKESLNLQDLQTFFKGSSLRHIRLLTNDLIRRHRIKEVFQALDIEKKGTITFPQIEAWMAKESYFTQGPNQVEKREFVLRKLEITRSKPCTLAEMQEEFADWSLAEIRRITHDLILAYRAQRDVLKINSSPPSEIVRVHRVGGVSQPASPNREEVKENKDDDANVVRVHKSDPEAARSADLAQLGVRLHSQLSINGTTSVASPGHSRSHSRAGSRRSSIDARSLPPATLPGISIPPPVTLASGLSSTSPAPVPMSSRPSSPPISPSPPSAATRLPDSKRFVNVIGASSTSGSPGHSRTASPLVGSPILPLTSSSGSSGIAVAAAPGSRRSSASGIIIPPTATISRRPSTDTTHVVAAVILPPGADSPAVSSRSLRVDATADPNDVAIAMNIKSPHIPVDIPL